jgi:hypothetical protein
LFARQPAEGAGLDTDGTDPIGGASATLEVAREALRIFEDDLTEESAVRLKAMVDGVDGFDWGGLS